MKRLVLGIFCVLALTGVSAHAESYSGYAPFPSVGNRAIQLVWKKLDKCGLTRTSAFDPALPAPIVPAQEAILSPRGELLAYYMEDYGAGFWATFKSPNGGQNHTVGFTNGNIRFSTPYMGTVAHGNAVATVGAVGTNLYCRSVPAAPNQFLSCIEAFWVNTIVDQLCQFGQ